MEREQLTRQLGVNIRRARLLKDMSQEALSLAAGLSPTYLGFLERGEKCPTVDTLYRICEVLDVPIYELLDFGANDKEVNAQVRSRIENAIKDLSGSQQYKIAEVVEKIASMVEEKV
ncbi:MAG: helix-turn-helix transcriptional regulator [Ruminococcaceae bacterium]|nr:helix-turn-helix transcriptional regulator [Oscillospiraceae bacterium]